MYHVFNWRGRRAAVEQLAGWPSCALVDWLLAGFVYSCDSLLSCVFSSLKASLAPQRRQQRQRLPLLLRKDCVWQCVPHCMMIFYFMQCMGKQCYTVIAHRRTHRQTDRISKSENVRGSHNTEPADKQTYTRHTHTTTYNSHMLCAPVRLDRIWLADARATQPTFGQTTLLLLAASFSR